MGSGSARLALLLLLVPTACFGARALVPLAPGGGTDEWCGWSPGATPQGLLAQMYLPLFFTVIMMRDALYESFGPLFYPLVLFIFLTCIMPNIDYAPDPTAPFNSFRPSTWHRDAASTRAAALVAPTGSTPALSSSSTSTSLSSKSDAKPKGSWHLGPAAYAAWDAASAHYDAVPAPTDGVVRLSSAATPLPMRHGAAR